METAHREETRNAVTALFSAIAIVMRVLRIYDGFVDFIDTTRRLERISKDKERDDALDDARATKTVEEALATQKRIVNSKP